MKRTESGKHDPATDPLVGQLVAEKWRVTERLERPARGPVYRVERVPTGEVALLEVAPAPRNRALGEPARFDREARIASQVKHGRLAPILDFGNWRDRPYVVSELLKGKTLGTLVSAGEMTPSRAVVVVGQILEAVRHMHAYGVVHRDVSLDSVYVLDSPISDQAKLSPPGLGVTSPGPTTSATRGDQSGDLLAVGRILQALCTVPASEAGGAGRAGEEVVAVRGADREIAKRLEGVIARATAPHASARFQSAEELMAAVAGAAAGAPARPPRPARSERRSGLDPTPAPRARRSATGTRSQLKLAWAVAGLTALAGAGVVIASARSGRREAPDTEEEVASLRSPGSPAGRPVAVAPAPEPAPVTIPVPPPAPAAAPPRAPPPTPAPERASSVARALEPARPTPAPKVTTPAPAPAPAAPTAANTTVSAPRPALAIAPTTAQSPRAVPPPRVPAPTPVPATATAPASATAPAPPVELVPITEAERAEVLQLIDAHDNAGASEKITALMQRDPRVAWPHVALAELHFRNLWRRDVVRQWQIAIGLDPGVTEDPHLANHLCQAVGPKWDAAGIAELVEQLGEKGSALLEACPR